MPVIHSDIIFQNVGYIQNANFSWFPIKQGNVNIFFKHEEKILNYNSSIFFNKPYLSSNKMCYTSLIYFYTSA
jgi:hypothetical protein